MILPSIQLVNEAACLPCLYPTCAGPSIECQSITVDACGLSLPEHEDVPPADRCLIFKRYKDRIVTAITFLGPLESGDSKSGSYNEDASCTYDYVWKTVPPTVEGELPGRECVPEHSSSHTVSETSAFYTGETKVYDYSVSGSSSSSPSSECEGSISTTISYVGEDPGEPSIDPMGCECPPTLDVNSEGVTYASKAFSKEDTATDDDQTVTETHTREFSEEVILQDLLDEIDARIALYGEDDWPGSECVSKVLYSELFPEDLEEEEEEEEPEEPEEPVCRQITSATKSAYTVGVPEDYALSVFEATWDEYFFSARWDAWAGENDDYEAAVRSHAEWVEGGEVGPEPVIPPDPGAEPDPKPLLIAEREWVWDGTEGNRKSERFVLEIPDDATEAGQVRRVNMAVNCWASTRYGRKPTFHGEIYVPSAEEEP